MEKTRFKQIASRFKFDFPLMEITQRPTFYRKVIVLTTVKSSTTSLETSELQFVFKNMLKMVTIPNYWYQRTEKKQKRDRRE